MKDTRYIEHSIGRLFKRFDFNPTVNLMKRYSRFLKYRAIKLNDELTQTKKDYNKELFDCYTRIEQLKTSLKRKEEQFESLRMSYRETASKKQLERYRIKISEYRKENKRLMQQILNLTITNQPSPAGSGDDMLGK